LPAASKPPITYSFPPAAAAPDSSSATGSDGSPRWTGGGDGDGYGESGATVGLGEGEEEVDGDAAACWGPAQDTNSIAKIVTAANLTKTA